MLHSLSLSPSSDYSDSDADPEMEEVEAEEDDAIEILSPPLANCETASSGPTAAAYGSKCTPTAAKEIANRYKVPPEYGLCAPPGDQRAHEPPAGYAAIYVDHFRNGLRLPLPPFLVTLLASYRIALAQLAPNCIVSLLGFLSICRRLSISPTTTLFRYFFRLQNSSPETEGWYTFHRRTIKIVYGQSVSTKHWKSSFLFFKTPPVTENSGFSWSWNFSRIRDPVLAEHERLSEETVDMFKANVVVRKNKKSRQSGEEERKGRKGIKKAATEMQTKKSSKVYEPISIPSVKATNATKDPKAATEMQGKKSAKDNEPISIPSVKVTNVTENPKTASRDSPDADCGHEKLKRVAEVYETKPAKALKGPTGKKFVGGSSQLPSVPGLKDLTAEEFARFIQKSVCSFNLQLQGEKEELEKVVEAKEQNLKERDNMITSLQGTKEKLEKVVVAKEQNLKERDNMITSLQGTKEKLEKENACLKAEVSRLQGVSDDRGPLLQVYTSKLLKTEGFTEFFYKLTTSAKNLGRHEAAELMRDRYPDIPEEALEDLEDPLAGLKLDNLFYGMIQDDAFQFPLLNYLLSLKEVPSSSGMKDLGVDEDQDALIAPPSLPV